MRSSAHAYDSVIATDSRRSALIHAVGTARDSQKWVDSEGDSEWAYTFFSGGWLPTDEDDLPRLQVVEGWTRSLHDDQNAYHAHIMYSVGPVYEFLDWDRIYIFEDEITRNIHDRGGWFYRAP